MNTAMTTTPVSADDRPRMDADIVCAGFGPVFALMSQFVTSKNRSSYQLRFVFYSLLTTS
jgi:hypothetical protein